MKKHTGYLVAAAFGAVVLTGSIAAGYAQQEVDRRSSERAALGRSSLSERQALERRRGRVADVAIAGTTVQ